jgi:cullin 1
MEHRRINDFDEGWKRIEIGITKLIRNVEGLPDTQFSSDEYMMLYTYPFILLDWIHSYNFSSFGLFTLLFFPFNYYRTIYDLGYRHGFSPNLYEKCKETIDEFNRSNVWKPPPNFHVFLTFIIFEFLLL